MIYATLITGKEYGEKFTHQVQRESVGRDVHILTDRPELFPNCKTERYEKKVFSYYDKLTFLVKTVLERKQRVTYIDCDWFTGLHLGLDLQEDTFYTYALWKFEDFADKPFSMEGIGMVIDALNRSNYKLDKDLYIGEAIMSLPYLPCTQGILDDLLSLQHEWESTFSQNLKTKNGKLKRYSSYGVGYGEGGALTAVLQKHNVNLKAVSNKMFVHNNAI